MGVALVMKHVVSYWQGNAVYAVTVEEGQGNAVYAVNFAVKAL